MFNYLRTLENPILVTGATGFKGTWLCEFLDILDINYVGIGLDDRSDHFYADNHANKNIEFVDMKDFELLKNSMLKINPSLIIHMASHSLVIESYEKPFETFKNNFESTLNLLEITKQFLPTSKILITTTDKVYKSDTPASKFTEKSELWGQDPYSHSKVIVEVLASAYAGLLGDQSTSKVYVARAGNVIGGGDINKNRLLAEIGQSIITGEEVVIRNPHHTRPFQYVLDALTGYLVYLESIGLGENPPQALNFANQEDAMTVQELVGIAKIKNIKILQNEHTSNQLKENPNLDLDANLAMGTIRWRNRVETRDAINLTMDWWKSIKTDGNSPIEVTRKEIRRYLSAL